MSYVVINPGENIQKYVNANPVDTQFYLNAGVYRGQQITPKDGQQFIGAPGAVLNGATVLSKWIKSGDHWMANGLPAQLPPSGQGQNGSVLPTYREDLFIDNHLYKRVGSLNELGAGKWYYDKGTNSAHISVNPTGKSLELSTTPYAFKGSADNVTVQNLFIEKYANAAQTGTINTDGSGWKIEDVTARWNHGAGIMIGPDGVISGGAAIENGQLGITGYKSNNTKVIGVEIARNNSAGFDDSWEAGGLKFTNSTGVEFRNNFVHDNHGTGLWGDISMMKTIYDGNVVYNNDKHGIFHEISYDAIISNNIIVDNGQADKSSLYKHSQLKIDNSQNVDVHHNLIETDSGSGNGIALLYQNRGSGTFGAYDTKGNNIHNNKIVYHDAKALSGFLSASSSVNGNNFSNKWDSNTWITPDKANTHWYFNGKLGSWDTLRAKNGFEPNGTLLPQKQAETLINPDGTVANTETDNNTGGGTGDTTTSGPITTNIVISAYGSPLAGVNAHFKVLIDGKKVSDSWATTKAQDLTYKASVASNLAHKIQIQYSHVGAQDRNLFVNKVMINGNVIASNYPIVTYDKGALDRKDVVAGQSGMSWNGTLVINVDKCYFLGTSVAQQSLAASVDPTLLMAEVFHNTPFDFHTDALYLLGLAPAW